MQDWGISALQAASLLVQMNVHALNPVAEHHRTPHLMLLSPLLPRRAQLLLTLCSSFAHLVLIFPLRLCFSCSRC